jgi:hypothetical protein
MRKAPKQTGVLIAVELGADWPETVSVDRNGAVRRVVAQEEGETPEAFAGRIAKLAARLFHPAVTLRDAVVACNERTDPAASIARRSIGMTLLERMGPSGTFVLAASVRAGGRLRHALSALAIDLAPEASATVTVHFDGERENASECDALRVA